MPKVSQQYLEVDGYKIIEKGFHKDKNQVSESIFSLSNEYMGVRGFLEEGTTLPSLIGTYFNGIIEYSLEDTPSAYKGIVKRSHFTINSVNFLKCKISVEGEVLDLADAEVSDFVRELDMKNGLLTRQFLWKAKKANIKVRFERLLDMVDCQNAYQRFSFLSDKDIRLHLVLYLDSSVLHWGDHCYWEKDSIGVKSGEEFYLSMKTPTTHQGLAAAMKVKCPFPVNSYVKKEKEISVHYYLDLKKGEEAKVERYVSIFVDKHSSSHNDELIQSARKSIKEMAKTGMDHAIEKNRNYFKKVWENNDIEIVGDEKDQQGIRYCLFQLEQNYHGYAPDDNIGAKGLTGEAYSGHAFWDSETYCLPYYLFSNQQAAKDLLLFRYNTLEQAKKRAKELDCDGACYPIATRNGEEACNLWQHASTQFQPTTAVGYAIWHYMNLYHDDGFMKSYGLEMMLEICKFLLSRGQYSSDGTTFGYYGVMGPDEFELMVNHNTYTNFMAKKMFQYLFDLLKEEKYENPELLAKCGYDEELLQRMKEAEEKMLILYDPKTHLYEQHEGFYKLPHIDVNSIPVAHFPLYSHWSYDRIYRNDLIKQPDVLMFMFLYSSEFSLEQKKANYDFYEPKCIHESSLSPSIHSIFASELGYEKQADDFFGFATRLDLDDYNRNTKEGLHMTSIAAAWMNIVYGFFGLRSDCPKLSIAPKLPKKWESYSVNLLYQNKRIKTKVTRDSLLFTMKEGESLDLLVYGKPMKIENGMEIKRPA